MRFVCRTMMTGADNYWRGWWWAAIGSLREFLKRVFFCVVWIESENTVVGEVDAGRMERFGCGFGSLCLLARSLRAAAACNSVSSLCDRASEFHHLLSSE